jgi:hypothetical protein
MIDKKDEIEVTDFDVEPDYVLIVKRSGASFIVRELLDLNLIIKEFPSKNILSKGDYRYLRSK